jgi:hypothetical protein
VAGLGIAIGGMVLKTAETADALVELSLKTGISTERLQELDYIGQQVGTDVDTIRGSIAKLTRSMDSAQEGTGDAAEAFKKLGVPVVNANGQLRDSKAVFDDAITALGGMTNETERDAAAMALFGKSAMELNPLIKAGKDELNRLGEEAHKVGAVMSEENVAAMGEFKDSIDSLKASAKGTVGTLATVFLPGLKGLTGKAKEYMTGFADVVKNSNGDLGKMADGAGALLGRIITDIASSGPKYLSAGLGILQGIIKAIVGNLGTMLPGVISMIEALVDFIVENLPMLIDAAIKIILALVNGIIKMLPRLITAAVQIIIALANGIAQALPQLIPAVIKIIPEIIIILLNNLPLLIAAALTLIVALAQGLITALPVLVRSIPRIVRAIYDAIVAALPIIYQAALKLVRMIRTGVTDSLPVIAQAGKRLVSEVSTAVKGQAAKLLGIGKSIVSGVWSGVKARAGWFYEQVKKFFQGIITSVLGALGMSGGTGSSSTGASIGQSLARGIGVGFVSEMARLLRSIDRAMAVSINGLQPTTAGIGGGQSLQRSESYTFYAPVTIGGGAGASIGTMIKAKRY